MMTPMRYILLVLGIIISLHYILSFSHEEYGKATSLSHLADQFRGSPARPSVPYEHDSQRNATSRRKAKASFIFLARNGDLRGVITSMKQMEDRFNKEYQYPWVFLNEEPFTDEFKRITTALTDAPTYYGLIPHDDWYQPDWIDEEKATKSRNAMVKANVIYGGSVPYRNMCRFNSGFFYRHELLKDYDWYWRVEPDVTFYCDVHYDPFLYMQDNDKLYGFTISLYEYGETIPTLWDATKEFIDQNPHLITKDNAMSFVSDDGGKEYNRCHFWSNFEIASLNLWRSEAYMKFFEHLDSKGGFYYERWGDAPVHSIGAALFARKDQIHFFHDIGYHHVPFRHCPQGDAHSAGKCWCDIKDNFDYEGYSCLPRYDALSK